MHHLSPADELAEIRAEIARLKAREARLRESLISAAPAALVGRWHRVEVAEHRHRLFDPALLPAAIRENPAFWRERVQTTVRTVPVQAGPSRPGWPIRRAGDQRAMH